MMLSADNNFRQSKCYRDCEATFLSMPDLPTRYTLIIQESVYIINVIVERLIVSY